MAHTKQESAVTQSKVNGIDVAALNGIVEAVKAQPSMAKATFGVSADTRAGFQTKAQTTKPTVGGQPLAGRTRSFAMQGDHPPELLGQDLAPTAAEMVLGALAACVSGGYHMYGAALGVPVDWVHIELEGHLDLQGSMNLPAPGVVRPGFERLHAKIRVKSKAPRAELEKVKELAESTSPVKDSLRAVPYTSELIVET